jgi:hypothetical protein
MAGKHWLISEKFPSGECLVIINILKPQHRNNGLWAKSSMPSSIFYSRNYDKQKFAS